MLLFKLCFCNGSYASGIRLFIVFLDIGVCPSFTEWLFGSLFTVTPTSQITDQLNGAWDLVLVSLKVDVKIGVSVVVSALVRLCAASGHMSKLSVDIRYSC